MGLQKARKNKGWSIPQLSRESSVPVRTIEDMERREREGRFDGKIKTVIKLAIALDVDLQELCEFVDTN